MSIFRVFILSFLLLNFVACSERKSEDSATITIQFDESTFARSTATATKIVASNTAGAPPWGLTDPRSFEEVGCYAVMVGGVEPGMRANSCTTQSGKVIRFGPRMGLLSLAKEEKAILEVPSGDNRRFYLLALSTADGTCNESFTKNPNLNFANFSAPFIIGAAVADLGGGEQNVPIQLKGDFPQQNKIVTCDFIDNNDTDIEPYWTPFESNREIWINTNPFPRTVQVTHGGSSIDCSVNGSPFIPCSGTNRFVWKIANRALPHIVRVNYDDGTSELLPPYVPDSFHSLVTFVACTTTIQNTETDFTNLSTPISTDGQIICLQNGTTLSDTATLNPGNDIILAVPQGGFAEIINTNTSSSLLYYSVTSASSFLKVLGVRLVGSSSSGPIIDINHSAGSGNAVFKLVDSELVSQNTAIALNLYTAGTGYNLDTYVRGSRVISNGGNGIAATVDSISLQIDRNSQVISPNVAVENYDSNVTIEDSIIEALSSTGVSVATRLNGATSIARSKIIDRSGVGMVLDCVNSVGFEVARLTLNSNIFIRTEDVGSGNAPAIDVQDPGTCNTQINSANDNLFCNMANSQQFTSVLTASPDTPGIPDFVPILNTGGSIGLCPDGVAP